MFCPNCGFEYTQKTNYCKRCGESLGTTGTPEISRPPRLMLIGAFWSITALGLVGLIALLGMYHSLWTRGARDESLFIPFLMGLMLVGAISILMIWQLSRLISAYLKSGQNIVQERPVVREFHPVQTPQIAPPTDQIKNVGEPRSVVEHTTRQIANVQPELRQK